MVLCFSEANEQAWSTQWEFFIPSEPALPETSLSHRLFFPHKISLELQSSEVYPLRIVHWELRWNKCAKGWSVQESRILGSNRFNQDSSAGGGRMYPETAMAVMLMTVAL